MQTNHKKLSQKIFEIENDETFEKLALEIFRMQSTNNSIYNQYIQHLKIDSKKIDRIEKIPFLPIQFFKHHRIVTGTQQTEHVFVSSGTTDATTSKHYVGDIKLYERSFITAFEHFYGDTSQYCILALLPSYLERQGSSLVYMVNNLIYRSNNRESGFYLNQINELAQKLNKLSDEKQKILLIGVSFALLDLVETHKFQLNNTIIMETGGMKGRRKELTRLELHQILKQGFGVQNIHSEYGMTELLSQAYSTGDGIFKTPPWMKIYVRDLYDPFSYQPVLHNGGVNVIDLANLNSCCFIETSDIGLLHKDCSFSVNGRFDNSDIRGCNLLAV